MCHVTVVQEMSAGRRLAVMARRTTGVRSVTVTLSVASDMSYYIGYAYQIVLRYTGFFNDALTKTFGVGAWV